MHLTVKKILLFLFFNIHFFTTCFSQSEKQFDIAQDSILIRLDVKFEQSNRVKLTITPIYNASLSLKEASAYFIGWREDVYKLTATNLLKSVFKEVCVKPDSLAVFEKLGSQLHQLYENVYFAFENKKVEQLSDIGYGLSDNEKQQHKEYLENLHYIQDTLGLLGMAIRKKYFESKNADYPKIIQVDLSFEKKKTLVNYYLAYSNYYLRTKRDTIKIYRKFAQKTLRNIDRRRDHIVHLVGGANVVSSFRNSNTNQVNAGFGLFAVKPGFSEFLGIITIAQTLEDSTKEYGSSILIPGVRRFSLLTSYRTYSIFRYSSSMILRRVGGGLDINITPYRWIKDSISVKAIPFALNFLIPYTWVHQTKPGKDYSISTEVGLSVRYIGGDISRDQLTSFIGNNNRWFLGPIVGINIKYNALRAQFHAPLFFVKDANRVQGLTNGQVYASIGIVAPLSGDLSKVFNK